MMDDKKEKVKKEERGYKRFRKKRWCLMRGDTVNRGKKGR